ncbi:HAD family hydrolase [Kribbella sp. VKM Ac-2568]|uniref:HAD family hydrolase n=1 Tax=Kribbella sp. VKM Ac-2568 TaxID=2512219 RepID=UPI001047B432|nr:HAD family hydrolase [Kribbella sp. VKM Ac-2568]TCM50573.1 putative membrane protein DUF2157 [Kribbella sp. VKM Ac-2568]
MKNSPTPGPVTLRPSPTARRTALVTETLAYLGGVVVLVGAGLIAARYWPDLHETTRLGIAGVAAAVLLCAALAVPTDKPAGRRMRTVIWLLSTAAASLFFGLLGGEVLGWRAIDTTLLIGVGTALYSAALWLWSGRAAALQLAFLTATLVSAGAIGAHLEQPYWPGLAVWFAALEWLLLGHSEIVPSRRPTQVAASIGLLVGIGLTLPQDIGILLGLATIAGLLIYAVQIWDLLLILIGIAGALQILPIAVTQWFPGRPAAPIALLIGGAALVGAAIAIARTSDARPSDAGSGESPTIDAGRYDAVVFDLDAVVTDDGRHTFPETLALIDRLTAAGLTYAVTSASSTAAEVLIAAGLQDLFDIRVDGRVAEELGLPEKPDPAVPLVAAHRLGVTPLRTVVVEIGPAGVEAGRNGGFGLVIGVDRSGQAAGLAGHGADLVVRDLAEIAVTPDREPAR